MAIEYSGLQGVKENKDFCGDDRGKGKKEQSSKRWKMATDFAFKSLKILFVRETNK